MILKLGCALMSNFRPIDRQTAYLIPPSVEDWLPEEHLARFIVEIVDGLDLRAISGDIAALVRSRITRAF